LTVNSERICQIFTLKMMNDQFFMTCRTRKQQNLLPRKRRPRNLIRSRNLIIFSIRCWGRFLRLQMRQLLKPQEEMLLRSKNGRAKCPANRTSTFTIISSWSAVARPTAAEKMAFIVATRKNRARRQKAALSAALQGATFCCFCCAEFGNSSNNKKRAPLIRATRFLLRKRPILIQSTSDHDSTATLLLCETRRPFLSHVINQSAT